MGSINVVRFHQIDAIEDVNFDDLVDDIVGLLHKESVSVLFNVNLNDVAKVKPNCELLRPLSGLAHIDSIQQIFDATTHIFVKESLMC
jgi:hypothetical protein